MLDSAVLAAGGQAAFVRLLALGGIFYHLYNQVGWVGGRVGGQVLFLALCPCPRSA